MAWTKTPDVAEFKGADWNNFVKTVPNCTPESAKRLALQDPNINFFFFCREYIVLENRGTFNPGDAVFFSGQPWFGSAPQCDSYQKNYMTIAYVGNCTSANLETVGCYTMADGSPSIDVACIFACNLNITLPSGYTKLSSISVPAGYPILCANATDYATLQAGTHKGLQAKGITVLMTVLGNHDAAGWSNFTSPTVAQNFADQLTDVLNTYGLDGIDIDDEYSNPPSMSNTSLAMITTLMKQEFGGRIISKALWADSQYFGVDWQGNTLEGNLTYGWQMGYGTPPEYALPPYVEAGMAKDTLSMGFWTGQPSQDPKSDVEWIMNNGYEGVMVYAFESSENVELMGQLVGYLYGDGNWNDQCG